MPVMPEPRLAVIADGRSGSSDAANNKGELEPTRSDQIDGLAKRAGSGICRGATADQCIIAEVRAEDAGHFGMRAAEEWRAAA
jgi:hypothetical protein